MLTRDEKHLEIFENFIVDKNLPKFKRKEVAKTKTNINFSISEDGAINITDSIFVAESDAVESWGENGTVFTTKSGDFVNGTDTDKPDNSSFLTKLKNWRLKTKKEPKQLFSLSVQDFFTSIKNSTTEIKRVDNRIEGYLQALSQSKILGQTALTEKLIGMIDVIRAESQLYALKSVDVVTEEQVVKFYKEAEKGLKLTWIKNFVRVIPSEFLKIKMKLDQLDVFDNYVVLSYDPEGKSFAETKAEIEKRKDPILFGVMKNSKKLYYIGDWVDEYCDLTLEAFIDKYGKAAMKKNNINSKIKLN